MEVALNQSWMSWCAVITCNNKTKKYRSSRPEEFCKKRVLRDFVKFTGKDLCHSLFFKKVAELRPSTLLKKRLCFRCFPVNFAELLRTPFFLEYLWWLLLKTIEKCLISDHLKIQVFLKTGFMLQATHLLICDPKSKIYENFRKTIPRNNPNMFIAILLSFLIYILPISFIQNCWTQAEAYSKPSQTFKMTFLGKILNVSSGVFTTKSNM